MARAMYDLETAAIDPLRAYLEAVGKEPLLTAEEEIALAQDIEHCHEAWDRLQSGKPLTPSRRRELHARVRQGKHARERFISANLRLVVSIAKRYQNQGLPLLDLIQEGNLGLIRAVEKFDWRRGFKFSTYATWWIRQAVQRGLGNTARTIRFPVHVEERVRKLLRIRTSFAQEHGRQPRAEELSTMMALPLDEIELMLRAINELRPLSLQQPVLEGEAELQDLIEDVSADAPYEEVAETLLREELAEVMAEQLSDRETRVLALRFGLYDGVPRSLQGVGEEMGLSRERVRQIERNALNKLRDTESLSA